jgi:hypothetical protein
MFSLQCACEGRQNTVQSKEETYTFLSYKVAVSSISWTIACDDPLKGGKYEKLNLNFRAFQELGEFDPLHFFFLNIFVCLS